MKKKRVSLLLAAAMLLSSFVIQPSFSAERKEVSIDVGSLEQSNGIYKTGQGSYVIRAEKEGFLLNPDLSQRALYLDFNGEYENIKDGSCVMLYVTYFDEGGGKFSLYYDSVSGSKLHPKVVRMKNTCVWKTEVYELQNPAFTGRVDGHDVKIALEAGRSNSNDKVILSDIKAEKCPYRSVYNAEIQMNRVGNAFFSDEGIELDVKTSLLSGIKTDDKNADITYEIINDKNETVWSEKREGVNVAKQDIYTVKAQDVPYGCHTFRVTVSNDTYGYLSKYETSMSYSIAARRNKYWGDCSHIFGQWGATYSYNCSRILQLYEKAGWGFTRDGQMWHSSSIGNGEFAWGFPQFETLQKYLDEESSISQMWGLFYGCNRYTRYHSLHKALPDTDESVKAYGEFAAWAATHKAVETVEVWNEPNTTGSNPYNTGWDWYSKMCIEAAKKVREVNSNIKVGIGSLVAIPRLQKDSVEQMKQYGALDAADALTVHPYIWTDSPIGGGYYYNMKDIRDWLDQNGYSDKEIWITEMGWGAGPYHFTQDEQAAYLTQAYIIGHEIPNFTYFAVYDGVCDGVDETSREYNFGVLEHFYYNDVPLAPRKSYVAIAAMNEFLADADFVSVEKGENTEHLYHYRRGNEDIYPIFSDKKGTAMAVKTDKEYLTVSDMYGNKRNIYAYNGVVNILGGEETNYIIGNDLQISFAEPTIYPQNTEIPIIYGENANLKLIGSEGMTSDIKALERGIEIEKTDEANATVSLSEVKVGNDIVYVNVKKGDRLYLDGKIEIIYKNAITVDVSNDLYTPANYNRWVGELTITNNSQKKIVSGKLVVDDPDMFAKKIVSPRIPDIYPGETKTVRFHFPKILRKETLYLGGRIVLDNGYTQNINSRIDFNVANPVSEKLVIDGVINPGEWNVAGAILYDKPEQWERVADGTANWGGLDDVSGTTYVSYDDNFLYIGATVKDDVHCVETSADDIWAYDSIQFSTAYEAVNGVEGSQNHTQIGMALTPDGPKVYSYKTEDISIVVGAMDIEEKGGEIVIKREGNITTYELKMPRLLLVPQGATFTPGRKLGFSMIINDNDGEGRKGWIGGKGIGKSMNVNLFNFLKFTGK